MQARVIQPFDGMPDGAKRSRTFAAGDIITGELARTAVDNGLAKEVTEAAPAAPKPASAPAAAADAPKSAGKSKSKGKAPAPDAGGEAA